MVKKIVAEISGFQYQSHCTTLLFLTGREEIREHVSR